MDLTEFLTARLDEDAAAAEAALPGPWHIDRDPVQGLRIMDSARLVVTWTPGFYQRGDTDAEHIARHDPARVRSARSQASGRSWPSTSR